MAAPLPRPAAHRQPALLRRLFNDPAPVLDSLASELGPVYSLGAGPARMAVVGDPAALRAMFSMPTESFRWGHKFNVLGFVVGNTSMIVSDGDDHRRRRSAVQGAFSRRRLNGWIPSIVEQTDHAADAVIAGFGSSPTTVDMYGVGRQLVLDVVVRSLFGARLAARSGEIGDLFERPQQYLESPAIRQLPHPFPRTRRARVRADRRALDAMIDGEIRLLRQDPPDDPTNVLATLVADADLSDGEIRDQVVTLMGAGFDTTSATLAWMCWRAALDGDLWDRLGDEADAVFGNRPTEEFDHSTLNALELADRVMRETTRLHPAGVISPREAHTDLVIGGYDVPAGTLILWSAHLAGRDPNAWTEPLRFDPDRFRSPTPEQAELANAAWVPFGRGQRNCIGFALAQIELVLIIARLAQRLSITSTATEVPRPVGMVVNRPLGGAPLTVSARGSYSLQPRD